MSGGLAKAAHFVVRGDAWTGTSENGDSVCDGVPRRHPKGGTRPEHDEHSSGMRGLKQSGASNAFCLRGNIYEPGPHTFSLRER